MHVFEALLDRPSIQLVLIKCRLHFIMYVQCMFEIEEETGVLWKNCKHLFYFIEKKYFGETLLSACLNTHLTVQLSS